MNGKFIISLDFELHWGGVEKWDLEKKKNYFLNTVRYIPELLDLFQKSNIRCTWATVGFLFAKDKHQLIYFSPEKRPTYIKKQLSYYSILSEIGNDEDEDPYHYAYSLIKDILSTPGQELASHTYAHFYCNEKGQTEEQFYEDLKAAQNIAKENFGVELKSLVFPRNQFNEKYIEIAKKNGIEVLRSNPNVWFWNMKFDRFSPYFRAFDYLVPISSTLSFNEVKKLRGVICLPASRFFRPYTSKEKFIQKLKLRRIKREMTYAAKYNRNYHLWWHPHNFGNDIRTNNCQLIEILDHYKKLNEKYKFTSVNMSDFIN